MTPFEKTIHFLFSCIATTTREGKCLDKVGEAGYTESEQTLECEGRSQAMDEQESLDIMNGHPLRVERCRRNMTQAELAEAVKVGVTTIWRAEKDYPVSAASRQRLCAYFGLTSQELGLTRKGKVKQNATSSCITSTSSISLHADVGLNVSNTIIQHTEEQYMNSSDFFFCSELVKTTLANPLNIDLFQHVASILNTPPATLQSIDEHVIVLWNYRSKATLPIDILYIQVVSYVDFIKGLLGHALLPTERLHLCDITSRIILLAGVLLYDMGLYPQARQVMQIALQAAGEANNPTLQAISWTWMSFAWTYTNFISFALPCILEADALTTLSSDRRVKAWIAAVRAEIHARLGQREECLHALQQADQDYGNTVEEIQYLFGFDATLLDGYRGVCLQHFYQKQDTNTHGYLQEARKALERALANSTSARRKLYYLGDFALVEARQGEVESACMYAAQSITNMGQVKSKSILRRLTDVRQLLQPYENTSCVKELDVQIPLLLASK